jgi:hypothetical protein
MISGLGDSGACLRGRTCDTTRLPRLSGLRLVPRLLRALLGYAALIVLVVTLYRDPWLLLGILLAMTALVLLRMRTRAAVLGWAVGAVLGPLGEAIAVWRGTWSYWGTEGLPVWLPPAWGLAALLFTEVAQGLAERPTES